MSMLRRTSGSLTKTVRQITQQQPVKDNVLRTTALGSAKVAVQNIGSSMPKTSKGNKGQMMVNQITSIRRQNPMQFLQKTTQFSLNVQNAKVVLSSNTGKLSKMFASFDLTSCQISFAGMMGDFAVWAITDMSTGELIYLIDDNGGSEILET